MNKIITGLIGLLLVVLPLQTLIAVRLEIAELRPLIFWKEVVVIIICGYILVNLTYRITNKFKRLNFGKLLQTSWPFLIFLFLFIWSFWVTIIFHKLDFSTWLVGIRFDLFWLGFLAVIISWSLSLKYTTNTTINFENLQLLKKTIFFGTLIGFLVTCASVLAALFFGQREFATWLGYNEILSGEIQAVTCNQIDFGIEACRLQGFFNTPNHLAGYLLLAMAILLVSFSKDYFRSTIVQKYFQIGLIILTGLFLIATISRFSWIIYLFLIFWLIMKNFKNLSAKFQNFMFFSAFILVTMILYTPSLYNKLEFIPDSIRKPYSSSDHERHSKSAFEILIADSKNIFFGFGIGTTGPASYINYENDKSFLNPIWINHSQIAARYGLTPDRAVIPENWFLQIWLNGGLLYFVGYLGLLLTPIIMVMGSSKQLSNSTEVKFGLPILVGLLFANTFLHIWENQTVAFFTASLVLTVFINRHLNLTIKVK